MLVQEETELLPISAAREGDPDAWRTLFERFRLPLFSYIRQLTGDDDLTLDLIQETFLNASRYIASLHSDDKFSPWLFGIARQKVVQTWRKKRVSTISLDDEFQAETMHEPFRHLRNCFSSPKRKANSGQRSRPFPLSIEK
jgi:RNA polymerase sigma factor (sigma-70 family)